MAKITIFTLRKGPHVVKIRHDREWSDHIAEVHPNGVYSGSDQDYHAYDDLGDAYRTGKHILNQLANRSGHSAQPIIEVDHRRNRKPLEESKRPNGYGIFEHPQHDRDIAAKLKPYSKTHTIANMVHLSNDRESNKGKRSYRTYVELALKDDPMGTVVKTVPVTTYINESEDDYKRNPKWSYEDARGVKKTGYYVGHHQGQGSDVSYFFKDENGITDVVSGERLKRAKRLWEEDYTKIPKVSNLYEAYAKVYAQDTLGVDVEELEEARTSGTRRNSGRGRITVHNFAKIPTYGYTPAGDVVSNDDRSVYDYTQTATLPDGKRSKVRHGDVLKNLPGKGKGVMYSAWAVRITGGEGKGGLERVAGYTGQSSDIDKLVGVKDGLKPKHAMRFRQTIGENWDDDRSMMRDIRRSQMSQKDIVDDEYRKADAAFKAYNELKARPSHTKKSREAMDYFSQKYMHHHHRAQVEASKLHPSTYNPYPNGPFEGENR